MRRLPDRTGDVAEAVERAGTRLQCRLPSQNLLELLFVRLLVDQLATREAVDLGAQLSDAVFIGKLHLCVPGDEFCEHVFAEGEIGAGDDGPHRQDHQRAGDDPEGDGSKA